MNYPYYIIPDIEALPEARGEERVKILRRIAAVVGDPIALREIIGIDPEEFSAFYPDMEKPDLSTDDTISSFLDRFGDPQASESKEVKEIEEIVPLPPPDFDLAVLEELPPAETPEDAEEDPTASLLQSFLTPASEAPGKPKEHPAPKKKDAPVLSESLARVMIKNGNYVKALEIITDLSLNNPKKSIYFADQIRFLKKLILNQSKGKQ